MPKRNLKQAMCLYLELTTSTDDPLAPQLIRRTKEISQRIGELEQKIAVRSEEIVQFERDKKRCELQY